MLVNLASQASVENGQQDVSTPGAASAIAHDQPVDQEQEGSNLIAIDQLAMNKNTHPPFPISLPPTLLPFTTSQTISGTYGSYAVSMIASVYSDIHLSEESKKVEREDQVD